MIYCRMKYKMSLNEHIMFQIYFWHPPRYYYFYTRKCYNLFFSIVNLWEELWFMVMV